MYTRQMPGPASRTLGRASACVMWPHVSTLQVRQVEAGELADPGGGALQWRRLMPGLRRLIAGVSIAAILLAVCLPGLVALDSVWLEFGWVLLPDDVLIAACVPLAPCDEQPVAPLSLGTPRGPPARPAL